MDNRRRMMWKKPQLNVIYYTSTDGKIVSPRSVNFGGVSIRSNTYNNGIGVIVFSGPPTEITQGFYSSTLKSITIPDSVTSIGDYAFFKCSSLTSVTIPDSVTLIGNHAFDTCNSLTNVTIPDRVTSIGSYAFQDCSSLINVTIPDSVTSIGGYAFAGCNGLRSMTLGSNVTLTGTYTFKSCTGTLIINSPFVLTGETTSNDYQMKFYGISFNELIIGDSITTIGDEVFSNSNCASFNRIIIGNSVTTIGNYAFDGCRYANYTWIPSSVQSFGVRAFSGCTGEIVINCNIPSFSSEYNSPFYIGQASCITISDSVQFIGNNAFPSHKMSKMIIGKNVSSLGDYVFRWCSNLKEIESRAIVAPSTTKNTFESIATDGVLIHSCEADYTSWMDTSYRLGKYKWTHRNSYEPTSWYDLAIAANDVAGCATSCAITWTCLSDGLDYITGKSIHGIYLSGTATSAEFPQNTSETETVERTITFEYQGLTASTTITQGVWVDPGYELVLNNNWQLSSVANPDSTLYDGVYESFSNYNVGSTAAIMYIDIVGYETFQLYIRSYAESNYDYVMVSQLDQTIDNNSSYSNTTLVKAHTRGAQKSGTTISDYKLVEFTGLDGGEHRITVVYRKDGSGNSETDKGYLIIPRQ